MLVLMPIQLGNGRDFLGAYDLATLRRLDVSTDYWPQLWTMANEGSRTLLDSEGGSGAEQCSSQDSSQGFHT